MESFKLKNKIIIALDGYSSCGKSTFAKQISALLGYIFIDTGAMYRAVTLYVLREGSALKAGTVDTTIVESLLDQINISFKFNEERGASDIYVNGECVEQEIRTLEVSRLVSTMSQIESVRTKLVSLQQQMGEQKGIVMDGRDIGTVVFPNAELKIFMTADARVRAQRRFDELSAKGENISFDDIYENVTSRDRADETREISPLRKAEDAIILDNSTMNMEDQIVWFKAQCQKFLV